AYRIAGNDGLPTLSTLHQRFKGMERQFPFLLFWSVAILAPPLKNRLDNVLLNRCFLHILNDEHFWLPSKQFSHGRRQGFGQVSVAMRKRTSKMTGDTEERYHKAKHHKAQFSDRGKDIFRSGRSTVE